MECSDAGIEYPTACDNPAQSRSSALSLNSTDLLGTIVLLRGRESNHGVRSHKVDQMALLLQACITCWEARTI